jgi:peptidoglycan/xylan/chitin deacetylase (PgdA/CDA1 family)
MVLAYHRVTSERHSYLYSVSREQLDEHLGVIAASSHACPIDCVAEEVTFDDGHESNHTLALGVLQKHRVRTTVFAIAGWMGTQPEYMDWVQLQEMVSLGHSIQSHGWSHRVLPECSDRELQQELDRSRRTLEDRLCAAVDSISMPHGRWDDRVLRACAAAGYQRVYTSDPWVGLQRREGVDLVGRYMVRRTLHAEQLRRLLTGDRAYVFYLRSQFRAKETVRRFIGNSAYRRLWSAVASVDEIQEPVA